ncbi:MAG: POTRA domain-containing protein, partial [Flavobacteriaceae bacterium]
MSVSAQDKVVSEISIEGVKRIKESFVRKISRVKKGETLDSVLINQDIARLKRLPSVSHAYFQIVPEVEGYRVKYVIEENFTLIPFANVYTSTNDEFAFRIGLQEFNFLGRNITLGGFYQYDNFSSYGVTVRAPQLFTKKLGLAFTYQDLTTQEPVFFETATADYKYNNRGFELLGLYEINSKNNIELGGSLFTEDYQYLFGATSPEVPQALKVDKHLFKLIY